MLSAVLVPSDVMIVESSKVDGGPERKKFGRMKLLQFSENHRPAYWGTWNKKTTVIHPRDPWAQDKVSAQAEGCVSAFPSWPVRVGLLGSVSAPALRGGGDAVCNSFLRSSWTMRWTVMTSGKKRSRESLSPTAKG